MGEGKPEFYLLEEGSIHEAEQLAVVPLVIRADRHVRGARQHHQFVIVLLVKRKVGFVPFLQLKHRQSRVY